MKSAVVVDCVRTAIGRSNKEKGVFREIRGDDLAAACVRVLLQRTQIDPQAIEDVIFGCTQQTGEHGFNVGRMIGLLADLPFAVAGTSVNRLCGSSLQALHQAAHAIVAGAEDVQIVGGVEHMQHLPMGQGLDANPKLFRRTSKAALHMGLTAEFLARTHQISRQEQDEFAFRSHQLASAAQDQGDFKNEIIPVWGRDDRGNRWLAEHDQCIRRDTNLKSLAALAPAFLKEQGTVTAGNSSPLNDGAAAMLVMSEEKAAALGLKPLVRIRATAVVGVEPSVMGIGPVLATQKVLQRAGLTLPDIDLIELNEAFSVQALACIKALQLDLKKVNVRGGALAIGHPLGASGARIATTLIHTMLDRQAKYGLATMCIGMGQGIATVFERAE